MTADQTDVLARHLHDLAARTEFGPNFEPYATLSDIGKRGWRAMAVQIIADMGELPDGNLVWPVTTDIGHDQPFGVFTSEQAAKDAVAKTPGVNYSSIFLDRIYT